MTGARRDVARQIMNSHRLSLWLFRLSIASFALAWVLPVFPNHDDLSPAPRIGTTLACLESG